MRALSLMDYAEHALHWTGFAMGEQCEFLRLVASRLFCGCAFVASQ